MNRDHQLALVEIARKCASFKFVASYDGNVSLRTKDGIYITATHTLKSETSLEDICLIDLSGKLIAGKRPPSTESLMHLFIYREREDVNGIVHTHPPAATAFASARKPLDQAIFPEVILDIGAIPLAEYASPSTDEIPSSLKPYTKWANAILLANHGIVVFGDSVHEAFYRTEKIEHAAKTIIYAQSLGGVVSLSRSEIDTLFDTHQTFENHGHFAEFQERRTGSNERTQFRCASYEDKEKLETRRIAVEKILRKIMKK